MLWVYLLYWYDERAPMIMSRGRLNKSLKSSTVRVSPIVSMIMPRMTLDTSPFIQVKISGTRNETKAVNIT